MKKLIVLGVFIFILTSCRTSEKVVVRNIDTGETEIIKVKKKNYQKKAE